MTDEIIQNYLNPKHPTAYSSIGNIRRYYKGKYSDKDIKFALAHIDSYTLHREVKKPARRNPIFVYSLREHIEIDLIDVSELAEDNDQVTFLLCAIDCFSRYGWIVSLLRKTAANSFAAIKMLVESIKPPIRTIYFDKGGEFRNRLVSAYLTEKNVHFYHNMSDTKVPYVERWNLTIQTLIMKHNTENETRRYIDVLQDLLFSYNNRPHSSLHHMTPAEAEEDKNQSKVLNVANLRYSKIVEKRSSPKFSVGQTVRIAKSRNKMSRGYKPKFHEEHFKIESINTRMPSPMYMLRSQDTGDLIEGGFYSEEITLVAGNVFKVEHIVKERGRGRNKQVLVKWKGYNSSHNSWEPASSITKEYNKQPPTINETP
jgi:hypothetical protein